MGQDRYKMMSKEGVVRDVKEENWFLQEGRYDGTVSG